MSILFWVWIFASAFVGWAASQRRRSAGAWFLCAILVSPLLAVLVLLAVPSGNGSPMSSDVRGLIWKAARFCGVCVLSFILCFSLLPREWLDVVREVAPLAFAGFALVCVSCVFVLGPARVGRLAGSVIGRFPG